MSKENAVVLDKIHEVIRELSLKNAYDRPGFWCNNGKDYKVVPTKYHKGYDKALEDVEKRIIEVLGD